MEEQSRRQASDPDPSRAVAAEVPSGTRRPVGWLFMGGALGAVAVIVLLVFAGVAMVMFVAGQQSTTRTTTGPAIQPVPVPAVNPPAPAPPVIAQTPPAPEKKTTSPPSPAPARPDPPRRTPSAPPASVKTAPAPRELPPAVVVPPANAPASSPVKTVQQLPSEPPPAPRPSPLSVFDGIGRLSPPADVKPAPAPRPPAVVTPELRQLLADTIRYADAAEIQAYRTFNAGPLARFYVGDLLQAHLAKLQENARNQIFEVNTLHQQQFEWFSISPDGMRAQVRLTEYWSEDVHAIATGRCLSHVHERPVPQTLSLQLTGDGWKIYAAEFHTRDSQQLVQCH